jgi:hypothetical protein
MVEKSVGVEGDCVGNLVVIVNVGIQLKNTFVAAMIECSLESKLRFWGSIPRLLRFTCFLFYLLYLVYLVWSIQMLISI